MCKEKDQERIEITIADVAHLHGLHVLGSSGAEIFCVCPFCGNRKKKFSYIVQKGDKKNKYKCFSCGEAGNMTDLHKKLSPAGTYDDDDYRTPFIDILKAVKNGGEEFAEYRASVEQMRNNANEAYKKPDEVISKTLYAFLKLLTLKDAHKADLIKRGLSEEDIKRFRFRSLPDDWKETFGICRTLLKQGYDLEGVPGFYVTKSGDWTFKIPGSGYLCPVFDGERNLLIGFQARMDNPEDGRKYLWLSSAGKEKGCSSGALSTCLPGNNSQVVIVTEGILKATVIYSLLKGEFTIIGIPGVSCLKSLDSYIERYPNSSIYEAYDMDKAILTEDPHEAEKTKRIADAATELRKKLSSFGNLVHPFEWDVANGYWKGNYKGLDDFLLAYNRKDLFIQTLANQAKNEQALVSFLNV